MSYKKHTFNKGDLVRLKDGSDERHFEIEELFTDNPPEASLFVAGSRQKVKEITLDRLEKVPIPKRPVRSAPRLPLTDSRIQSVASPLPDKPAVEMFASDKPSNKDRHLLTPTSDKESPTPESSNSSHDLVELSKCLTRLLSHLQTKSAQGVQSPDMLTDPLVNARNLIDKVHQTFDDIWDDIERRLRKESQEARIQLDRSQKYEIKIEHLSGVNLSLEVQVRSLLDHVNHIESDQANRELALHQLKRQEQTHIHSESIRAFWKAREDFYRGVHRGILAEQGSNRKRLKNFRYQSLCADMELIAQLGGTLELFEEALRFDRCPYDGFLYRWYDEDEEPVPNGTLATVFLPGWQVGDTQVKASLGRNEVDIE